MTQVNLAGDIMIGSLPFMLAKQKHLDQIGADRAWHLDFLEKSRRRRTGVDRNTSAVKDSMEFVYRWERMDRGYGDAEDVRDGRFDWGYCDSSAPLSVVCPHKITIITLTGATANVTSIVEATDNGAARIYAAAGRYIFVINPSNDTFATIDCGVGEVAQDLAVFEDYLYIAMTTSKFRRFGPLSTGGSLSAAHADLTFRWFHVANETLWGTVPTGTGTAGTLRKCAAGASGSAWTTANWAAGVLVGLTATNLNKPINLGLNIFMGKPEGFFTFNSAAKVMQLLPDFGGYLQQLNFHHGAPYRGRLYLPHETGLYAYMPSNRQLVQVGPEMHELNTSAIKGYVREVIPVGRFLYIAIEDSSGNTYILKGWPANISERESWAWSPLTKLTTKVCRAMYFSNLTEARLWFGNGTNISYYDLGATPTYENGQITFPLYDDGYPFDNKILETGAVEGTIPTGTSIGLYYTLDGGTERTVGAAMTADTLTAISANNVGKRLSIRVALNAKSDNSDTPKLRAVTFTGVRRPSARAIITAHILCTDDQRLRQGQQNNLTAEAIIDQLETWQANTSSLTVVDPTGTSRTMILLPDIKYQEVGITEERHPEIAATIMLREN